LDVLLDPLQGDTYRLRQATWTWRGRASAPPRHSSDGAVHGLARAAQDDVSDDDRRVVRLMRSRHTDTDGGGHGSAPPPRSWLAMRSCGRVRAWAT